MLSEHSISVPLKSTVPPSESPAFKALFSLGHCLCPQPHSNAIKDRLFERKRLQLNRRLKTSLVLTWSLCWSYWNGWTFPISLYCLVLHRFMSLRCIWMRPDLVSNIRLRLQWKQKIVPPEDSCIACKYKRLDTWRYTMIHHDTPSTSSHTTLPPSWQPFPPCDS